MISFELCERECRSNFTDPTVWWGGSAFQEILELWASLLPLRHEWVWLHMVPRQAIIIINQKICLSSQKKSWYDFWSVESNSDLSFVFEWKSLCFGNFSGQYYAVSVQSQPHHTPRTLFSLDSAAHSLLKIAGLFLHVCIWTLTCSVSVSQRWPAHVYVTAVSTADFSFSAVFITHTCRINTSCFYAEPQRLLRTRCTL